MRAGCRSYREARERKPTPVDLLLSLCRSLLADRRIRSPGLSPKGCALRLATDHHRKCRRGGRQHCRRPRCSGGADGYTLSIGNVATHVLNGAAYSLSYDLLNDFEAISLLTGAPAFIDAKKTLPAKDLKELIAWLKANPNKASAGVFATWSRLFGAYFQSSTGTHIQFVPYRGAAPAMQDLVAGQIDLMFDQAANTLPQLRNGNIKAYAVAATNRLALAPDIPTMEEAGVPGFYLSVWHGMWAPKGTSKNVIAQLNSAIVAALANPAVQQKLSDLGQEIPSRDQQTPEALSAYQRAEAEKWWPIIKAANIRGD